MSSRGRGFSSRGNSYRGRGGSDWNSSSNSSARGGYSSSRGGRFKYSTPNYDSRSKYGSGPSERYSSRGGGRGEHSNSYKRPRESYSGRDDHRSSNESTRKRMRNDSYQGGGSSGGSQRYSSYGSSSTSAYDDNKRSSSSAYEDKRQNERASSYHRQEDRHSASRSYGPQATMRMNDMAPPTPRYTSNRGRISHQSGTYRGRSSRGSGRGFNRLGSRSDSILARKRTALEYRRKLLGSRSRDYIQRVRMTTTKMRRSSGTIRLSGSKKETGSSSSMKDKMAKAINAEFSDDDEEDENKSNWDDDEKPHDHDEDEEEEDDDEEKKKDEKRKKEKQDRDRENSEDEEEKNASRKDDDNTKNEIENDEEGDREERDENKKSDRARSDSEELPSRRDGRRFIKLNCPHCVHRSVTFKDYSLHLYSGRHNAAMRRVAAKRKAELARMRVLQRQEQKRIEARDAQRGTLPSRTIFCPICKLNYRSLKAIHQLSESHRQMKRFLTPFCRICRVPFRSPMLYETHVCSLDHIKRKSLLDDKRNARNGNDDADSSGADDDKEVNLENFMTLDSVGDVDEDEENGDKKKKESADGETASADSEKKVKNKQMIKVGAEYIKPIEAYFCELCKCYLPHNENTERAVALHCSTRSHLKRYVRDNDDKALRREAERIHLQTSSSTTTNSSTNGAGVNAENSKNSSSNGESQNTAVATAATTVGKDTELISVKETSNTTMENVKMDEQHASAAENIKNSKDPKNVQMNEEDDDEYPMDNSDKLWEDVDKDLGDILRETEPGAKSSDDEDTRYDRFRNSEKKQQAKDKEKKAEESSDIENKEGAVKKLDTKIMQEKIDK